MPQITAPQGKLIDNVFYFPARVYYEDTDAGGVVYYANYLRFAERARTEFIRSLGFEQQEGLQADRTAFVVRHCEVDYRAPAVLDDLLCISCQITEMGGASCTMHQEIMRDEKTLVAIDIKVVYVNLNTKRPIRMPEKLKQISRQIEK